MKKYAIATLFIIFLLPIMAFAQEEDNPTPWQFNGFVDTYHAVRRQSPHNFMSSRTRFRGELQKAYGKSSMFVSFNLNQNSLLKEWNNFELREAYFNYTAERWGLRAGRQLIIWGNADAMRITDLVSPMDMTEFLARDYDDIRMPVEAIKFNYFVGAMTLELVYIPVFKGFVLPTDPKNPWSMKIPQTEGISTILAEEKKPELNFKNGEIGGRMAFALPGIDFSLSGLYTWNKMPTFEKSFHNGVLTIQPTYHRMTFVGFDLSKPLGQFVLRAESAYNFNKHFAMKTPNGIPSQRSNTWNYLAGLDWYAPKDWMLSVQYLDEVIFKHFPNMENDKHTQLMTINVSKSMMNNSLKLSNFVYADIVNGGFFNRFSTDYSLTDQIHLLVGYDHFYGDKGIFSIYKDNSQFWMKAKYSF